MSEPLAGHDKYEGMFMGSELGFSYRCKCGWTSDRYPTEGEAFEAASQHEKGGTWRIFMPHSLEPATVASFLTEDQAREQIEAWKVRAAKGGRPDLAHVDLDALEVRRVR